MMKRASLLLRKKVNRKKQLKRKVSRKRMKAVSKDLAHLSVAEVKGQDLIDHQDLIGHQIPIGHQVPIGHLDQIGQHDLIDVQDQNNLEISQLMDS